MRSRAPLLIVIATTGCMNEYHPEFHPVTTTTFVQNVSAPTTVVNESVTESRSLTLDPPVQVFPAQRETPPKRARFADIERSQKPKLSNLPVDPPQAPGTYLGPNVEIGPGVTFGGNVYVQGDLIIGGTRTHPVLTTR